MRKGEIASELKVYQMFRYWAAVCMRYLYHDRCLDGYGTVAVMGLDI